MNSNELLKITMIQKNGVDVLRIYIRKRIKDWNVSFRVSYIIWIGFHIRWILFTIPISLRYLSCANFERSLGITHKTHNSYYSLYLLYNHVLHDDRMQVHCQRQSEAVRKDRTSQRSGIRSSGNGIIFFGGNVLYVAQDIRHRWTVLQDRLAYGTIYCLQSARKYASLPSQLLGGDFLAQGSPDSVPRGEAPVALLWPLPDVSAGKVFAIEYFCIYMYMYVTLNTAQILALQSVWMLHSEAGSSLHLHCDLRWPH